MGLAIVWGTVKDHNGYIDVQSRIGDGTTFTLYFPVTREEMTSTRQSIPMERYMGNGESVLVVDDIAEQRDIAAGLLAKLGYEVHTVSSGEEAVTYLEGNQADILVLDMIMDPGIDAWRPTRGSSGSTETEGDHRHGFFRRRIASERPSSWERAHTSGSPMYWSRSPGHPGRTGAFMRCPDPFHFRSRGEPEMHRRHSDFYACDLFTREAPAGFNLSHIFSMVSL